MCTGVKLLLWIGVNEIFQQSLKCASCAALGNWVNLEGDTRCSPCNSPVDAFTPVPMNQCFDAVTKHAHEHETSAFVVLLGQRSFFIGAARSMYMVHDSHQRSWSGEHFGFSSSLVVEGAFKRGYDLTRLLSNQWQKAKTGYDVDIKGMVWTWDIDGSGVPETPLVISEDPPVIVVDEVPEPMPSVEAASLLLPPVVPAPAPSAHELACAAAPDLAPSALEIAPLRSEFHSDAAQSLTPLVGPGPVAGKLTPSLGARELAAPADPTPSAPAVEPTLVAPKACYASRAHPVGARVCGRGCRA